MGEVLQRAALAMLLSLSGVALAHNAPHDKYGCHNDRKAGSYHCHEGPQAGKTFASKEAMLGGKPPAPDQPPSGQVKGTGHYDNVDGQTIHKPAHSLIGGKPNGATGRCKDGSYTFAQHKTGACSKQKGLAQWFAATDQ